MGDHPPSTAAIRVFTPRDQAAVQTLVLDGLRERWGDAYRDDVNPDLDDITGNYVESGADVVVAEAAGDIVACGLVLPEAGDLGRILRVSVEHGHRRQGLARALVTELVARARDRGVRRIVVRTDTPWESALALYRSIGFVQISQNAMDTHFEFHL